jgi:hypothetical protein
LACREITLRWREFVRQAVASLCGAVHADAIVSATALTAIAQKRILTLQTCLGSHGPGHALPSPPAATASLRLATAQRKEESTMKHPSHLLNPLAVATIVAVAALAACEERKSTEAQTPSASSGEYPTPSETAPPSSSDGKIDSKK